MPSPYAPLRIATLTWFAMAVAVMLTGIALTRTPLYPIGFLLSLYGLFHSARNFGRLAKLFALEALLQRGSAETLRDEFNNEGLPRQVFHLLFAVAEADGEAGPRERELVRKFLLPRFIDPRVHADLMNWNAERIPTGQVAPLVHRLRTQLTRPECETLFYWCCALALVDQRFAPEEHEILQVVSKHLGIEAEHARRLFLQAKLRILAANRDGRQQHSQRSTRNRKSNGTGWPGLSTRGRALQVLGLPDDASAVTIRARHRELVKQFHPDAHRNLGEVAAREATDRFHEVQAAYETLTER